MGAIRGALYGTPGRYHIPKGARRQHGEDGRVSKKSPEIVPEHLPKAPAVDPVCVRVAVRGLREVFKGGATA
jgi:hypothetical protein